MFVTYYFLLGFRGRGGGGGGGSGGGGGGGPNFDIKGGDWPCPNRFVCVFYALVRNIQQKGLI